MTDPSRASLAEPRPTNSRRELRVASIESAADWVRRFDLVDPDGAPLLRWRPGAHIDLLLPSGLLRAYMLCGRPDDIARYQIAVLAGEGTRSGARELFEDVHVGDVLGVIGPRNAFALVEAPHYLFLVGGIGVAPVLPMIHQLAQVGASVEMLYAGHRRSAMAFLPELENLLGAALTVVETADRDRPDIDRLIGQLPPSSAIYCCGPPAMIRDAQQSAVEHKVRSLLHFERFVEDPEMPRFILGEPFQVELHRSGITLPVGPHQTLLSVIERAVPEVRYGCRGGRCGECITRVLNGKPVHRDVFLDPGTRDDGDVMMICVSRSAGSPLVLDL